MSTSAEQIGNMIGQAIGKTLRTTYDNSISALKATGRYVGPKIETVVGDSYNGLKSGGSHGIKTIFDLSAKGTDSLARSLLTSFRNLTLGGVFTVVSLAAVDTATDPNETHEPFSTIFGRNLLHSPGRAWDGLQEVLEEKRKDMKSIFYTPPFRPRSPAIVPNPDYEPGSDEEPYVLAPEK